MADKNSETNKPSVLLVDDADLILDLLQDALEEGGYQIIRASSGTTAIALLDEHASHISGMVTDINLGDTSGWEVARHARELNHDLAVVYVTGADSDQWSALGVPKSVIVKKPFAAIEVVVALANLMVKDS